MNQTQKAYSSSSQMAINHAIHGGDLSADALRRNAIQIGKTSRVKMNSGMNCMIIGQAAMDEKRSNSVSGAPMLQG